MRGKKETGTEGGVHIWWGGGERDRPVKVERVKFARSERTATIKNAVCTRKSGPGKIRKKALVREA